MYISIYIWDMYASIIGWGDAIQHTLALTGQTCIYVVWVDGWIVEMGGWEDAKWQTIGGSIYLIYHVLTVTILICYEVNGLRNGTRYNVRSCCNIYDL